MSHGDSHNRRPGERGEDRGRPAADRRRARRVAHGADYDARRRRWPGSFTRAVYVGADDSVMIEQWTVHGADMRGQGKHGLVHRPSGPDASAERLRFFLGIARQRQPLLSSLGTRAGVQVNDEG